MANPHKGDVPFQVGEKTYTLCYSHLALVKLEKILDKSVVQIMSEMAELQNSQENMRIGTLVAMLWAGLQKHHPKLTYDETADLLDDMDTGLALAMEVIGEAFTKAFSAPGTKGTNPTAANGSLGTGMPSSLNTSVAVTPQMTSGRLPQEN